MNSATTVPPPGLALWSGLRQWVELDPTNGTGAAADNASDAPEIGVPDPQTVSASRERPAG